MARAGRPTREESMKKKSTSPPPPVRTGGRVKKAKVVFDPSESYQPRKRSERLESTTGTKTTPPKSYGTTNNSSKSGPSRRDASTEKPLPKNAKSSESLTSKASQRSSISSGNLEECSICKIGEYTKSRKLIDCIDCSYKVHPRCLNIQYKDFQTLKDKFRCNECKTCASCYEDSTEGPLVTCSKCIDSYHFACHIPKVVHNIPELNKWCCMKCMPPIKLPISRSKTTQSSNVSKKSSTSSSNSTRASIESNKSATNNSSNRSRNQVEEPVIKKEKIAYPDHSEVINWTPDNVTEYFQQYYPKDAHIFTEMEVDGKALLALKRSDIVRYCYLRGNVKFGALLNIFSLILKVQNQSTDEIIGWE